LLFIIQSSNQFINYLKQEVIESNERMKQLQQENGKLQSQLFLRSHVANNDESNNTYTQLQKKYNDDNINSNYNNETKEREDGTTFGYDSSEGANNSASPVLIADD
jgi:uncharacterized membrane protein YfhO